MTALSIPEVPAVVTGTVVTSTHDNLVKNAINLNLNRPLATVFSAAGGSAATGVWVVVNYDTDDYDPYSMHENVTHPSRITPNIAVPCVLEVHTFARWSQKDNVNTDGSLTGHRSINLRVNAGGSQTGGTSILTKPTARTEGQSTVVEILRKIDYTPGDYYETFIWQNSGLTLLVEGGGAVTGCQVTFMSLRS